jgi:WD40 repeat protein
MARVKYSTTAEGTQPNSLSRQFPHINQVELTRLIIQTLADLGYNRSVEALKQESGLELDSPVISQFIEYIHLGEFKNAELTIDHVTLVSDDEPTKRHIVFLIRRLEFLARLYGTGETASALTYLRQEINDLTDPKNIRALTSLLMNKGNIELQKQNGWIKDLKTSKEVLIDEVSKYIDPNEMIPKHRLFKLIEQSVQYQRSQNLFQFGNARVSLYEDSKPDRTNFPDHCAKVLSDHSDEVWYVSFSHDGRILATASADNSIILYDTSDFSILRVLSGHDKQVMYVSFSPDDSSILSCSLESHAHLWDVATGELVETMGMSGESRVWCCDWLPDGSGFVLGSPDKEIGVFDSQGHLDYKLDGSIINDLKVSKDFKLITVTYEKNIEVWDLLSRQKLKTLAIEQRITSVSVSEKNPNEILINVSPSELQLWDWSRQILLTKYVGHKQEKFVLRSCFGYDESLVISGSEDGRIFVWNKQFGALLTVLDGHKGNTNCVCWGPGVFASSGDDGKVKVWGPTPDQ